MTKAMNLRAEIEQIVAKHTGEWKAGHEHLVVDAILKLIEQQGDSNRPSETAKPVPVKSLPNEQSKQEASSDFNASDEWHRYDWIDQDDRGFFERPFGEPKGEKHYFTQHEVIDFLLEGNLFLFDKVKKLEARLGYSEYTINPDDPNVVVALNDLVSKNLGAK